MKLWDYQKKAVEFMSKTPRSYLALDLGMGKTITSLATAEEVGKKNILLVAEKTEIVNSQNFRREVEKHFGGIIYYSLRETDLLFTGIDKPSVEGSIRSVCGINPEGLKKHNLKDINRMFDVMIIDEATLAKTTTSNRFKIVHKIAKEMDYLIMLSGTPMLNGASELYAPLLLLDHTLVSGKKAEGKKAFERIFAGGHDRQIRKLPAGITMADLYGRLRSQRWKYIAWWAKGANHVRELRYLLRDNFFFMLKGETDVFKKKVRTVKYVQMGARWLAEYVRAWENYLVEAKKRKVDMENVKELKNLIENGQCYQVNSRWKAKSVAEDIAGGVYGNKRIVAFSMFVETDKIFQELLAEAKVSFKTFEEIDEWKAGNEQVIVGRIKANSKGANLPEASVCIFIDMDFVPSNNIQAENRIDRPEQENEMLIIYYLTEGKDVVDTHVRNINKDKARKINKFMQPLTKEEIEEMPNKLKSLREKYPKETTLLGI